MTGFKNSTGTISSIVPVLLVARAQKRALALKLEVLKVAALAPATGWVVSPLTP